ncbi:c-type cytochrome [Pseudoroseicyclus aestuarii]|uniref:Cytochrome c n=1 Tax=Pseudoroseicyclus aestuarii TaxID=1795041 RepID=A0A318SV94_9RHOB|nr:c-type cytochrome [Pseudoroseicyclus aestuarii]PYE84236.1 cytochrome c [Pseudoroseicyclus aestuarii]
MKTTVLGLVSLLGAATPAMAQDVTDGALQFSRQCTACHVVTTPDGTTLAGRGARTGPNLYGIEDGRIASADFSYGDGLTRLGEAGASWTEQNFVDYLADPNGWVRERLDTRHVRSKMAYRLQDEGQARDIWAYLLSLDE